MSVDARDTENPAARSPKQSKKSVYLDGDVEEALKASAKDAGRSVTKQLNYLLRMVLFHPPEMSRTTVLHQSPESESFRPFSKDQQLGRRPKKLT